MDGDQLEEEPSDQPPVTLEEQLDKLCVYYMAIGVPYEVFWHGDYCCLKYYEEAYLQKRKIHNEEFWMMGMYNYVAHATVLGNAFRSKGAKVETYCKKPLQFFPKTKEEEAQEAKEMREHLIENLTQIKRMWDKDNVGKDSGTDN